MATKIISAVIFCVLVAGLRLTEGQEAAPVEVAKASGICRYCSCNGDKVDCFDKNITVFFSTEQWLDLKELNATEVDLSENYITNVTMMSELSIQKLNLSRNSIEFIEDASFRDLQKMRVLDLSHNKLTTANLSPHAFEGRYSPEEYEPLASMRVLSLAYNDLHSLHRDLFEHLPELTELDLSGNPLVQLDYATIIAVSSLPNLQILRMRSCQLTEIPDKFLHTPRFLQRLDLSDNKLVSVPQELAETKNLVYLNLNQNPIIKLQMGDEQYPGFPLLRKLQELHMCNMPELQSIGDGALGGLQGLISVHIALNPKLSTIHPRAMSRPDDVGETFDWPPVKELFLHSNNLTEIDSRLLSRWDLVQKIDVTNNPYMCDCSTQWMVDFLVPVVEAKNENASEKMVCQEPIEMRGNTMMHLHEIHRTMRCVDKYGNRPERDGAILMGTLIGVLLSVPIMLSLVMLWRRGYFSCIGMRGPRDDARAFYKRAPAEDGFM